MKKDEAIFNHLQYADIALFKRFLCQDFFRMNYDTSAADPQWLTDCLHAAAVFTAPAKLLSKLIPYMCYIYIL